MPLRVKPGGADERALIGSERAPAPLRSSSMSAPSSWGKTPQQSIRQQCAKRGKDAVVAGCIDLLEGRDVDGELILALGGPPRVGSSPGRLQGRPTG